MVRLEDWLLDGGYEPPTAIVPANFAISWISVELVAGGTQVKISVPPCVIAAGSYEGAVSVGTTFTTSTFVINTNTQPTQQSPYILSGLTPGQSYVIRLRAYSSSNQTGTYGEYAYTSFVTPKSSSVVGVSGSVGNSGETTGTSVAVSDNRSIQRSFFTVTSKNKDLQKYSVATKSINISTSYNHYVFGAGIFFDSPVKTPKCSGGIAFFVNDNATTGYFIEITTEQASVDNKNKSVKIVKFVDGVKKELPDSQEGTNAKMYGGIIGSTQYKVDVKVEITSAATIIDLYINNFKISAADVYNTSATATPIQKAIPKTNKIAVFSNLGSAHFDYIYSMPLSQTEYNQAILANIYSGQFGDTMLNFAYGDKLINNIDTPLEKRAYIEEFGTVARELRKVKINFAQPGAYPSYASTGVNQYANIIGSRFTNHGAEVYVANNAGTFIPLQSGAHNFFIIGNYISINGSHEYTEESINEYTTPEPATFQSTWIQTEQDAKSLFTWAKNQWSKQQQSVNLEIFGNPAIEVGDVITINYPKNNLDSTKKFVVTNVDNSFGEGLQTTITARSFYS